jgi:hypothetical protein
MGCTEIIQVGATQQLHEFGIGRELAERQGLDLARIDPA